MSFRDAPTALAGAALTSITRAYDIVFPQLQFIAQARDPGSAKFDLCLDIGNAVRAAIASDQDSTFLPTRWTSGHAITSATGHSRRFWPIAQMSAPDSGASADIAGGPSRADAVEKGLEEPSEQ